MAHYLAERMTSLEQSTGSERSNAETEVADLILRLWSLRREIPGGRLFLAEVDEVETTIAKLTLGRRSWTYLGSSAADTEPTAEETETKATLKAALLVDGLAGDLVHGLIGRAAVLAEEHDAVWVKKAEEVGDRALSTVRRICFADNDSAGNTVSLYSSDEVKRRAQALSSVLASLVTALEAEDSELRDRNRS